MGKYHKGIRIEGADEFLLAVNITGHGAPTEDTEAEPGMCYLDEDSEHGDLYKCIGVLVTETRTVYRWKKLAGQEEVERLSEAIADLQKGGLLTVETITVSDDNGETETIPVTGITLDYTTISLNEGESMQLAASVIPSNATNTAVTWESSADSIATVVNGYVTAVSAGSAVITAKSVENTTITATCTVNVVAEEDGGDVPPGTKVQLSNYEIKTGYIKNDGTITGTGKYVEVPYSEGMFIHCLFGHTNETSGYAAIMVKNGDTNTKPEYTISDETVSWKSESGLGTTLSYPTTATLTGYPTDSTVLIAIISKSTIPAEMDGSGYYYYIAGGET